MMRRNDKPLGVFAKVETVKLDLIKFLAGITNQAADWLSFKGAQRNDVSAL